MCSLGYNNPHIKGVWFMNNNYINSLSLLLNSNNNFNVLYQNMSTYQKEIFNNMRNDSEYLKNYSLSDLIFDFDSKFVESILSLELDLYLEECKKNGIYNKRNGSTKDISIATSNRILNFNRPRLRNESNFDSMLIPKRTKVLDDLSNNIILLYSKNNSVNDIKDILSSMFNLDISTGFISNVTSSIQDQVLAWRNKDLKKCYLALNIDCMYITLRDNKNLTSHKVPVYIAVGTSLNGYKEIVGMYLGNEDSKKNIIDSLYETDISESKSFWIEIFNDLKDRGVKEILYVVSDGVTGIKDAIKEEFPNSFYQRCVVHIVRNLKKYVNKKDTYIISDFKKIYTALDKNSAVLYKDEFLEKYKDNKTIIKYASKYIDEIMPLFDIPINIRKYIYTNNIVESVNSKVQRGFYGRGALPNADSAINIIYVNLLDLENKWKKSKISNWTNIFNELQIVHKDVLDKYL